MTLRDESTQRLITLLESADDNTIIGAARELASRKRDNKEIRPHLLNLLAETNSAVVRNETALLLSDLKDPAAFNILTNLLSDSRTKASRGTLIYALGSYDCTSILELLVDQAISGSFEAARQSVSLIEEIDGEIDEATWQSCTSKISSAIPSTPRERQQLLGKLLSLFTEADSDASDSSHGGFK